jgi:hypothetical protein
LKPAIATIGTMFAAVVFIIFGIVGWSVGWTVGHSVGVASTASVNTAVVAGSPTTPPHFYLVIHQGEQLANEPLGPAYMPSTFTLPASTTVTITITNFDSATPLPNNFAQYGKASGIDTNSFDVAPLDPTNPNAKVPTTRASQVDPHKIAHTFTIRKLNLNVPIAATSTETFSFHTPAAGTYDWRCMDPCGIGPAGWNGAMSTDGYMQGKVTFA